MTQVLESGRALIMGADVDWDDPAEDFRVVALDSTYTFDASDTMLSHLSGVVGSEELVGRAVTSDAKWTADDVTTGISPSIGVTVRHLFVYHDTGVAATSALIAYYDTNNDATAFNRPGDGNPIEINWPGGVVIDTA